MRAMFSRLAGVALAGLVAFGCFAPSPARAAFGPVAYQGQGFTSVSGNNATMTTTSTVAAGDFVLVWTTWARSTGTINSVTDNQNACGASGTSWVPLTQATGTNAIGRFFYCVLTGTLPSGSTLTMNVSVTATTTRLMQAASLSGVAGIDKETATGATGSSATAAIPSSGTFTNARTLVFGGLNLASGQTISALPTQGGTWSPVTGSFAAGNAFGFASVLLTSNAQITPSWALSGSGPYALVQVGLTEASPPSGGDPPRLLTLGVGR